MTATDQLLPTVLAARCGFLSIDPYECIEQANGEYAEMLGRSLDEVTGRTWRSFIHPQDHTRTEEALRSVRASAPAAISVRAMRPDGSLRSHLVTITLKQTADPQRRYACLVQDVSACQSDQEAFALAMELAPSGLLLLDESGRIRTVNRAVELLFGYSRHELAGQLIEILLPCRLRAGHRQLRERLFRINAMAGRELAGCRKDGAEIPIQVHLNSVQTPAGTLILCNVIDIAERARYEQQLELSKRAAELANRAKTDFLARMSHEIRTPMNLILGMNSLLLEEGLTEHQREQINIVQRNMKRLLRLINGILDISKVESGQLTLDSRVFSLRGMIADAVSTVAIAVREKGLQLRCHVDDCLEDAWIGDPERLQQVLLNLLGNAVKFTAQGEIDLRVDCAGGELGPPLIQFKVSDTGCGVPAAKANAIFDAFQQVDSSMNRRFGGTGLGLTIARTLVEMMGGTIWLEPGQESGSTFVFTAALTPASSKPEAAQSETVAALPADPRPAASAPEPGFAVPRGTRILVAEDNPENVVLLQAYLAHLPVDLSFATNGQEALDMRCEAAFDIILMDVQMPVMDGYTAARQIREWETRNRVPRVPILALTAHALVHAAGESIQAGCDDHLSKPVEREDLVAAIARLIHQPPRMNASQKPQTADPIAKLRPQFLSRRQRDASEIRRALENRDFVKIQRIGHDCKGMSRGYGFPGLGDAGAELERAARAADADLVQAAVLRFEKEIASAIAEQSRLE